MNTLEFWNNEGLRMPFFADKISEKSISFLKENKIDVNHLLLDKYLFLLYFQEKTSFLNRDEVEDFIILNSNNPIHHLSKDWRIKALMALPWQYNDFYHRVLNENENENKTLSWFIFEFNNQVTPHLKGWADIAQMIHNGRKFVQMWDLWDCSFDFAYNVRLIGCKINTEDLFEKDGVYTPEQFKNKFKKIVCGNVTVYEI